MQVDLGEQLKFPTEILTTNLWPDLVLWSAVQKSLFITGVKAEGPLSPSEVSWAYQ